MQVSADLSSSIKTIIYIGVVPLKPVQTSPAVSVSIGGFVHRIQLLIRERKLLDVALRDMQVTVLSVQTGQVYVTEEIGLLFLLIWHKTSIQSTKLGV